MTSPSWKTRRRCRARLRRHAPGGAAACRCVSSSRALIEGGVCGFLTGAFFLITPASHLPRPRALTVSHIPSPCVAGAIQGGATHRAAVAGAVGQATCGVAAGELYGLGNMRPRSALRRGEYWLDTRVTRCG
jgi:hypothetical protein